MTRLRAFVILLFTLVSCCGWVIWLDMSPTYHPWGDLARGSFTDHFSHMNAARAFARIGTDIYRFGPRGVYPAVEGADYVRLPADVRYGGSWTGGIYALPGLRRDKPWVTSWSDRPRLYPPGDLLLVSPVALLYDQSDTSLAEACTLLIMLFMVYSHVSLGLAFRLAAPELKLATPVLWASVIVIYLEAVHWTLQGFYDFAAAAPLIMCIYYLRERRAVAAALCYCIAAFFHFRVFFLAPLSLYAAWIFIVDRQWRSMTKGTWAALAGVVVLSVVVLWVFKVLYPTLSTMPVTNVAHFSFWPINKEITLWVVAVALVCALVLAYARAWVDLAILIWLLGMMLALREAQPWHSLLLMVWLLVPAFYARPDATEAVRFVRGVFLAYCAVALLRGQLWPSWIPLVWKPA